MMRLPIKYLAATFIINAPKVEKFEALAQSDDGKKAAELKSLTVNY
jgi:hypothetical protein